MVLYFAQNFKQLRRNSEMTQEDISAALGVSPQAVSRWETGATLPDIGMLPIIAEFFLGNYGGTSRCRAEQKKSSG